MDIDEKLINNIVSYFSETRIIKQFKDLFLEELRNDQTFQQKLNEMLISDELVPGDEMLWKKIIENDINLLPQDFREKLFKKFEELLQQIFKSTQSAIDQ